MKITLVPTAGLCNRMNAILCAIASYEQYKIPTEIYWEKTNDCYADFSDLFEPLNNTDIIVKPLKNFYLKPGGKKLLFLPDLFRKFIFDVSYKSNRNIELKEFKDFCNNGSNIYVTSYNRYCLTSNKERNVSTYFEPAEDVMNRINQTVDNYFTANTIGVHIRRTDNLAAMRNSPIERFIDLMDKEIENNSETVFYLATDCLESKKMFIGRYKDRIIQTHNVLNRSSLQGMKDAVTELYCLGKTKKIIGSNCSTYSGMAARLYNIDIIY